MAVVSRIWTVGGYRALNPKLIADTASSHGWPMPWYGKVNSVTVPRGRSHGEAHFLLPHDSLEALDTDAAINIQCQHENGTTTLRGYYVIASQAATRDASKPPHWVTLADRRWVLERTGCSARYNIRKDKWGGWLASTVNSGTPYTWQQVLNALWALLPSGIAGTCPTLPVTPSSTPENLVFDGISTWRAINQVLTAIGCAAVLNPSTGAFSFILMTADQSGLASTLASLNQNRLLWNFKPHKLAVTNYPANAGIVYPAIPDEEVDAGPFRDPPVTATESLGQGGIAGTLFPVTDTMFARSDNAAARATRSTEIGLAVQGYFRPMADPWGAVYSGIVEFLCGGQVTEVTWISDGHNGMRTIVKHAMQGPIDWPQLAPYVRSGDIHFDYRLATNWFGGIALAHKRTMDQTDLGQLVIVRDPRGIFSFQKAGDGGIMFLQPTADRYYVVQADCNSNPSPPVDPVGACCYQSSDGWDCFDATDADCTSFGGTWKGSGTSCAVDGCP